MPKQTLSALISYLYGEVNGSWASIKDNIYPSDGEFSFNEWGKKKSYCVDDFVDCAVDDGLCCQEEASASHTWVLCSASMD